MTRPPATRRPPLAGDDLVLTLLCTAAGPLLWWCGSASVSAGAGSGLTTLETALAAACTVAGTVVALWWALALMGVVLAAVGSKARSARVVHVGAALSPAFLRRVAASALGAQLVLAPGAWAAPTDDGLTPPAAPGIARHDATRYDATRGEAAQHRLTRHAAEPGSAPAPGWWSAQQSARAEQGGQGGQAEDAVPGPLRAESGDLPSPVWRLGAPAPVVPGAARADRADATSHRTVTVRAGDCLWDIAAEELGPYATDLEIDRRWREWHRHNRAGIGPNADVLLPGTVLTAPPIG